MEEEEGAHPITLLLDSPQCCTVAWRYPWMSFMFEWEKQYPTSEIFYYVFFNIYEKKTFSESKSQTECELQLGGWSVMNICPLAYFKKHLRFLFRFWHFRTP